MACKLKLLKQENLQRCEIKFQDEVAINTCLVLTSLEPMRSVSHTFHFDGESELYRDMRLVESPFKR